MPQVCSDTILAVIPKLNNSGHRGIGLLETIWKLCTSIINRRLTRAIHLHDDLHGFRRGRGTSTAIIEAKLAMQLAHRSPNPYYFVFLDLTKAYDSLHRSRTLDILRHYGVGPNLLRILSIVWRHQRVVPCQAGFYGSSFSAFRGVTQGDIISPTLFNIVTDAVLRA
jgi:retron-type reverse transcriptase